MTYTLTTQELRTEARAWASDCLEKKVSTETAMRYVSACYPNGWEGFVRDIGTYTKIF